MVLSGSFKAACQPTPGYMRLLKATVIEAWKARRAEVHADINQAPALMLLLTAPTESWVGVGRCVPTRKSQSTTESEVSTKPRISGACRRNA